MYHTQVAGQAGFSQGTWPIGTQKLIIDLAMCLIRIWQVRYPSHVFYAHETNAAEVINVTVGPFMHNRRSIADAESLA